MRGFKSFADRTDLNLHNGTTVIVGPNGSGKSNISDALRWVLGETSARNLRGTKMEDVIYVGSDSRRGLGFAEVEMILDNTDKALPIDFSEVSISRRLYKSGESEYAINHSPCRAKDIRELFMDTGVGRDGYSIIGQGRIDSILSDRPEDRRSIFEEVAGIVKHKNQKEDAERKLEKTNQNLIRIGDLLAELMRSYEEIHIQAEKTKKYHALYDELKNLDIAYAKQELFQYLQQKAENLNYNKEILIQLEDNEKERNRIQQEFEEMKGQVEIGQERMEGLETLLRELLNKESDLKSERDLSQSRLLFLEKDISRLETELSDFSHKIEEEEKNIFSLKKEFEVAQLNLDKYQQEDLFNEDELKNLKEHVVDVKNNIEKLREENSDLLIRKERLSQKHQFLQKEHSAILSATTLGKESGHERESKKIYLESEIQLMEGELGENEKKLSEIRRLHNEKNQKIFSLRSECKNIERQLHDLDLSLGKKESEKKTLSVLEEAFEGYQKPVREIMQQFLHRKEGKYILGTVSELFQVSSRYLQAIEVSLGSSLQYLVIQSESAVQPLIHYLKEKKLGRATFLPLENIRKNYIGRIDYKSEDGIIGYADQLLHCEEKFRPLFLSLLSNTLIVESMDVALKLAPNIRASNKIVTLDGELFHNKGSITGGYLGTKLSGILHRKNRIMELGEQIEQESQKRSDLKAIIEIRNKNLIDLETSFNLLEKQIQELEKSKQNIALRLYDLKRERDELLKDIEGSRRFQEEEERKYQENFSLMKNIQEEIVIIEGQLKKNNQALQINSANLFKSENKLNDKQKIYNENHLRIANLKNKLSNIDEKCLQSKTLIDEWNYKMLLKKEEHKQNKSEHSNLAMELSRICDQLQLNSEKNKVYITEKEIRKAEMDSLMRRYYSTQEDLNENHLNQTSLERKKTGVEIKIAKSEVQAENIISRIFEDYQVSLNEEVVKNQEFLSELSLKRIPQLKNEIAELGSVNTNAVEEERRLGERLDFMLTQEEDLRIAKSDLETVIATVEEKMGTLFRETLSTVQEYFTKVYTQFFGGGTVELKLSNPEDPLNSGIEILLTPPGKKMQAISLLSGGEKALTAIALLFAIQKIKPSPFCILDEIDAALDEVNIDRFTRYLKSSLDDVQFILITHRKKTMEIGDSLYGISMGDDGVSSVLSVRLKDKMIS